MSKETKPESISPKALSQLHEQHAAGKKYLSDSDNAMLELSAIPLLKSQDPIALVEAYVEYIRAGAIPPIPLLVKVYDYFSRYLEGGGKTSLSKAFNLSPGPGGHSIPHEKKRHQGQRQFEFFMVAMELRKQHRQGKKKLNVMEACREVIKREKLTISPQHLSEECSRHKILKRWKEITDFSDIRKLLKRIAAS